VYKVICYSCRYVVSCYDVENRSFCVIHPGILAEKTSDDGCTVRSHLGAGVSPKIIRQFIGLLKNMLCGGGTGIHNGKAVGVIRDVRPTSISNCEVQIFTRIIDWFVSEY